MMEQDKVLAAIDNLRNDIVRAIAESEKRILDRIGAGEGKPEFRGASMTSIPIVK